MLFSTPTTLSIWQGTIVLSRLYKVSYCFSLNCQEPSHLQGDTVYIVSVGWINIDIWRVISFVIQLSHSLGKEVLAEGGEDKETLEMLKYLGVIMHRGYYFTMSLEVDGVLQYIKSQK